MAKCRIYYDQRVLRKEGYPIKIELSHKGNRKYIPSGFLVQEDCWDFDKSEINSKYSNSGRANIDISTKFNIAREVVQELKPYHQILDCDQIHKIVTKRIKERLIDKLERSTNPEWTLDILKSASKKKSKKKNKKCKLDFFSYAKKVADKWYKSKRGGSADQVMDTISSLKTFTGKSHLTFDKIDKKFLIRYENWYCSKLNSRGVKNTLNGLGFRTKEIRRVYNLAKNDPKAKDVTLKMYPFGKAENKYTIRQTETAHKNIEATEIKKIYDADLTGTVTLHHHKNYFMFYFECWGMNFKDLANLKMYQVKNNVLTYKRRKTNYSKKVKEFSIILPPLALKIYKLYSKDKKPNDYIFPVIDDIEYILEESKNLEDKTESMKLYQKKWNNKLRNHIRRLQVLAKKAGVESGLTTYVARHSYFSIALENGVPKSEISEMAGHNSYTTTEAYLKGFNKKTLAERAKIVSQAVSSYVPKREKTTSLNDLILVSTTGESMDVLTYLVNLKFKSGEINYKSFCIALMLETNIENAELVHFYVHSFVKMLQSQEEKDNTLKISA